VVSKLDPNPSSAQAPSRRGSNARAHETISTREPYPPAQDPDLRVTLSAASRRLSESTGSTPSVEPEIAPEPADRRGESSTVAVTRRDAYREAPRPSLGERISIRA